jgi:aspartyl-tRNA(Asn)/glutamyl-tRNA(Gln) amidotransferase subunit A
VIDPFRSIEQLSSDLRDGTVSAVAVTEAMLARIASHDGILGAFTHVAADARAQAEQADRDIRAGRARGLLHGIPIAIKDNYLTADMPTTAGTAAPGLSFPLTDSAVARRLRQAGAVLIGKTRTHEFAWGTVTPPTRNPWHVERVPGGSSGGSGAAVAAGLCAAALGSDTGGSIRIPASLCGVVGFKPTFGRVSRAGIVPHSWSLDHAGPLTRTVADAAILYEALAGPDPDDPACSSRPVEPVRAGLAEDVAGLRVGVCRDHFFGRNQGAVAASVEDALAWFAEAGAEIREVRWPNLAYGLGAIFAIELASSTAYHHASLRSGVTDRFQPDVRLLVEIGRYVTGADYLRAEQMRRVLMEDSRRILADVDVLVGPTTPLTAWPVGAEAVEIGGAPESVLAASWRLTYPFNLTGMPAVSVPCGLDADGLPIGLQIAGRAFDEGTVLRAAHAYERAHGWASRRPAAFVAGDVAAPNETRSELHART